MNYNDIVNFIHSCSTTKTKDSLEFITILLSKIGDPQKDLKCVHITGTNGKGSTSSFISTIVASSKYNVGFLVSPYIHVFNERFQINNVNISDDDLVKFGSIVRKAYLEMVEEGTKAPTQFEINTAIGFLYFKSKNVDLVVLEAGIGGRFDATNVIESPLVSIITSIGLDHTDLLGDSLEEIADNKADIIKKDRPAIVFDEQIHSKVYDAISKQAKKMNSNLYFIKNENVENFKIVKDTPYLQTFDYINKENNIELRNIKLSMLGEHQVSNSILAIEAIKILQKEGFSNITDAKILEGLEIANWPGRFEIVNYEPIFIVDGAHNTHGVSMLIKNLEKYFPNKNVFFAVGFLKEKNYASILDIALKYSKNFVSFCPQTERALDNNIFTSYIENGGGNVVVKETPTQAAEFLMDTVSKDDIICLFGSLYNVADLRKFFHKY